MNVDLTRVQKILDWVKSQIFLDAASVNTKTVLLKEARYTDAISAVE